MPSPMAVLEIGLGNVSMPGLVSTSSRGLSTLDVSLVLSGRGGSFTYS